VTELSVASAFEKRDQIFERANQCEILESYDLSMAFTIQSKRSWGDQINQIIVAIQEIIRSFGKGQWETVYRVPTYLTELRFGLTYIPLVRWNEAHTHFLNTIRGNATNYFGRFQCSCPRCGRAV